MCEKTGVHFFGNTSAQDVPIVSPLCLNFDNTKWGNKYDLGYSSFHWGLNDFTVFACSRVLLVLQLEGDEFKKVVEIHTPA